MVFERTDADAPLRWGATFSVVSIPDLAFVSRASSRLQRPQALLPATTLQDSFVRTDGWVRGALFVNGINLGR